MCTKIHKYNSFFNVLQFKSLKTQGSCKHLPVLCPVISAVKQLHDQKTKMLQMLSICLKCVDQNDYVIQVNHQCTNSDPPSMHLFKLQTHMTRKALKFIIRPSLCCKHITVVENMLYFSIKVCFARFQHNSHQPSWIFTVLFWVEGWRPPQNRRQPIT